MRRALLSDEQIDIVLSKHICVKDAMRELVQLQDIRTKQKILGIIEASHTGNLRWGGFMVLGIVGDDRTKESGGVYWDDFKKGLMWL